MESRSRLAAQVAVVVATVIVCWVLIGPVMAIAIGAGVSVAVFYEAKGAGRRH